MPPNFVNGHSPRSVRETFEGSGKGVAAPCDAPSSYSSRTRAAHDARSFDAARREIAAADSYEHPERFWVDYVMEASSKDHARELARELCLEQTVELPGPLDAVKQVEAYTVGTIERIELLGSSGRHLHSHTHGHTHHIHGHSGNANSLYRVSIAFPNDTAGHELHQFLNVVFGNTSLKKGVSVENVTLSPKFNEDTKMFPGPRFGIKGLRRLLGVPRAPLLCTALKPMGRSSEEFADMAYSLARGGIDIIKDDHGLSDQVWAPFESRVRLCSEAVLKANRETGRNSLYAPCLNAPSDKVFERAQYAKDCGAGAVMVLPGLSGWDVVRRLACDDSFGLPILIHPAMLGGWLQSHPVHDKDDEEEDEEEDEHPRGLSHEFLFGVLPRLCGGDAVIFPNAGGRFQFTDEECQRVAEGCRRPLGRFEPILPSPAGGMKLHRVSEMRKTFGDDTLFLIGGALLERGPDLEEDAREFARSAGRDMPYCAPGGDKVKDMVSEYERHSLRDGRPTAPQRMARDITRPSVRHGNEHVVDRDAASIAEVEMVANAVRRRVLEYTLRNNGGYLSQACSSAETLATLYLKSLKLGPSVCDPIPGLFRGSPGPTVETITGEGHNGDPNDPGLDRIIFSPVHYALVLYSLLVEVGRLDVKAFESYNKDGSTVELIGAEHSPGHAVTAGSLAQALSQAAGIAYARKLKGHTGRVIVYMSDGEVQEGQFWEAVQAMVFHKIAVTAVVDVNGQQCDGKMGTVCDIGNIGEKLRAFGAEVREVDGHSVRDIDAAMARTNPSGPTFVLCNTDPCHGFPLLRERAPKLHYVRFKDEAEKRQWEDILARMEAPRRSAVGSCGNSRSRVEPRSSTSTMVHTSLSVKALATTSIEQCSPCEQVETVTRPHRKNLVEWMKHHPEVIVLTADLTSSCEADLLRDTLPDQYLSMGMAEQNMMSFAGGLAREGFRPFIHTFGVFVTRRPFDQVAMSIGVPNLPVRLLGFLPGLTTPGGVTHQAIDDVALMRSIPNMRVLEVGDATEVESVLDAADSIKGPVYVRMLRGEIPRLFPTSAPMRFGAARLLVSKGQSPFSRDSDVAVITTGICTEEALKARAMIESSGVSILHLHLSTIVPFPTNDVMRVCNFVKCGIVTMENHSVIGGLGSATAEVLAERAVAKPLIRLGVPAGTYAHGASREYLIREYGFDAHALIGAIGKLVGKDLTRGAQSSRSWESSVVGSMGRGANLLERPEDL